VGFRRRLHGYWELMVSEKEAAIESIPKSGPHLEVTVWEPQGEARLGGVLMAPSLQRMGG